MRALIYDEVFPDIAPVEIDNVKSVIYTQKYKLLQIDYIRGDSSHTMSINMDSSVYKRKVVFE